MGAGKTTIGRAMSRELDMMFYDLDWYIETRMHRSVAQIFAEKGEESFRKMEYNMLHEVAEFENVIISCGGGTPCHFDNMDYLNRQGETVYLKARAEVLCGHLKMCRVERPLIKGKSGEELQRFVAEQLKLREPYYNKAKHHLDVSLMDNYEKIKISVAAVREMLGV